MNLKLAAHLVGIVAWGVLAVDSVGLVWVHSPWTAPCVAFAFIYMISDQISLLMRWSSK